MSRDPSTHPDPPVRDDFLHFHRPTMGEAAEAAVIEVMRSGWLTSGGKARAFEAAFARLVGVEHAVAVNSCTSALHLALELLGIGPGDEVLVPTTTFAASANVVVHVGATPILCDIDAETLTLDPEDVRGRLSDRSRALIPVHLGGHPCAMSELVSLASEHQLELVEDAAHAIETEIDGKHAGAHGAFGAFSFYPTKSITTGEGGMLTTDRSDLIERARILALHGLSADAWKRYSREGTAHYAVVEPGYKYNLSDLQAAIGLAQLERLADFHAARRRLSLAYAEGLGDLPVTWQPLDVPGGQTAHHLFILLLDPAAPIGRDALVTALRERQIGTSIHFRPLHLMPYYAETYGYQPGDLPVAEETYARCLSLPLYPSMTVDDVGYVVEHLRALLA